MLLASGVVALVGFSTVKQHGVATPVALAAPGSKENTTAAAVGSPWWLLHVHTGRADTPRALWRIATGRPAGATRAADAANNVVRTGPAERYADTAQGADHAFLAAARLVGSPAMFDVERGVSVAETRSPARAESWRNERNEAIRLATARPLLVLPPSVHGRSGSLLHALLFLDGFKEGDLSGGLQVAATGTVGPGGTVGGIGEINLKLDAAQAAGVDVVFVPQGNRGEWDPLADRGTMVVVEVSSLTQAARWLCANTATTDELCSQLNTAP